MKQSFYAWQHAAPQSFKSVKAHTATKRTITTILLFLLVFTVANAQPWTQLSYPSTDNVLGIHFVDDQIGYVVGYNGGIRKTINGGATWSNPQVSNTTEHLYATYFIDANSGFAVGDNGVVRRTDNGGTTWSTPSVPGIFANHSFRAVWFFNAYEGYITGGISTQLGTILKTTNGGLTWVDISPTQNGGSGGKAFYGIFFTTSQTGYACDFDGRILTTNNGGTGGGASWTAQITNTTDHLADLHFVPTTTGAVSTTGFAVGGNATTNTGVVLKTTNGGTTWTNVTNSVINANPNVNFFSDVTFFGNTGFISGGNIPNNTTVIYKTTDGGLTWKLQAETILPLANSAKRLVRASLPCSHTGYACGLNGTILKVTGINEKICCDSFNNTFINTNFSYTNSNNVYTFTKPAGTLTGDILTWDFGDGQVGGGSPIIHAYPSVSGSYLATLTIGRPQIGGDTCRVKLCRLIDTKPCPNQVVNGDFNNLNIGFTTLPTNPGCTDANTGTSLVATNFQAKCTGWNNSGDHTTGSGNFLLIDGVPSGTGPFNVWKSTAPIAVTAGTTYIFSFWVKTAFNQPTFNVEMAIENATGVAYASRQGLGVQPLANWTQYSLVWVATTGSSPVTLTIKQTNSGTDGKRDFGIDDIAFSCVDCEDFMTEVMNFGIQSTLVSGNTYKYCVSPNVSPTDIVQWDMDCNGTIDATTSTSCQNFTLTSANSQLCATVLHVIKAGDTCRARVNTCLPNTVPAKACVCDSTFITSVNAGFTWAKTTPYTITFTPLSLLNNCDSIKWTASGISGFIGSSLGSNSITYTFPSTPGTYQICMLVTRTTPSGTVCKREICLSITLTGTLRAADIEIAGLVVKPNPTTHSASISIPETLNSKANNIRITSLEGRTMHVTVVESLEMTLNLENLPSGMYFLSLYDDKGNRLTRPTKFVKQ